jgi:hypothetical protein
VDALLYGEVREAGAKDEDSSIVRLTLVLADVETGEQIASANVSGIVQEEEEPISETLLEKLKENWKVIGIGIGVVVVLLVFISKNSRPR